MTQRSSHLSNGPISLTPCLLLDEPCMQANIARMGDHLQPHDVVVRPHVKTVKSLPVIERMTRSSREARLTVSTLREATEVIEAGYRDVLYAVGVVPQKLPELHRLAEASGAQVSVILDSLEMAEALVAFTRSVDSTNTVKLTAFIELDVDDHRAGVLPESDELLTIGAVLASSGLLRGVMTHAGGSYDCRTRAELVEMAERERVGAAGAAGRLRDAGMACPEVSIGSTPTVSVAESFTGVTEVRVGVYVFNDLVMAGLGVCDLSQIALSVLTTVIGHQARRNTLVIDAGWMALSSDRGTSSQVQDQGLGRIVDSNLVVHSANQEHGLVQAIDGATIDFDRYPIGSELRVLPVHACATAAAFDGYRVIGGQGPGDWASFWPRFGGWVARQA